MVEQLKQLTQHDPRRIGPFEVLGRLGAGGMGLVYLARSASGRRVAIKTVRTELAEDQLFRVRFTREVEAARAVSGFYTAAVVDADPRAAVPWLATAYVPAPSLEEIVNECGPLPAQAVRWLAAGIAEALQSIHGAGLVHRDLKPSNVLVVEDGPRVIDFGIASGVSNTRLTMTNVAVGTPAYMSPEQARDSRSVTGASDVFSLGSTLVFAATGHAPFHGANPVETVFMLLREGPDLAGLPAGAVALIEGRRGGRSTVANNSQRAGSGRGAGRAAPAAPPSPPVSPPMPASQPVPAPPRPESAPVGAESGWPGQMGAGPGAHRGGDPRGGNPGPMPQPAALGPDVSTARVTPVSAAPPAAALSAAPPAVSVDGAAGPVRLGGSPAPIGPGPRADSPGVQPRGQAGAATNWVRPPGTGPVTGVPPQGPANGAVAGDGPARGEAAPPAPPEAPPAEPGRWRPWRFRMSNDVWGTPAVADDLLYVTSFEVHALDVASGRRKFKTRDVAWAMAVADGRIHASDGPSLYALDADDGTERWRLHTEGWVYALKVDRGTVVTSTRGGGVQAWEAANGELLWEIGGVQTDFETAEAGPVVHDGTVFVWADARLKALEARTGIERWSYPVGDAAACGGVPVRLLPASDGAVYVVAGTRVLAIDIARGDVRWHFEAPAVFLSPPAFAPGPAVTGGGVYLADYLGTVYALDPSDGRDRWRIATEARQSTEPVLVAHGAVHLGSGKALYTLDAVTGTPRWRFQAGAEVVGAPVVAEGRVHFGSADHCLYTLDAMGGQLRWKLATGGEITGSPVAVGGVVYACSKDRCVYALDAAKGTGLARRS
ncbi:outer membrane protein assembly factor BamB family protein [Streptomyces decoyicus]